MSSRWGSVLAIFAAVAVLATGVVIVVMSSGGSSPGAQPRPTAFLTGVPMTRDRRNVPASTSRPGPKPKPAPAVDSGCRLGQGSTRLADVPRDVTDRVDRAWERIEKWLSANAPATSATLAPPASDAQIAAAQQRIGVPLPAELIASLRRHNGTGTNMRAGFSLPPFYLPLSAEGIVGDAKVMCDVLVSSGEQAGVGSWWHGQVIPVAFDGGGGNLLLDQRPGRGGRLGDHSEESEMRFGEYPPTLAELLETTARSLETGTPAMRRYHPFVDAGVLDWDIR